MDRLRFLLKMLKNGAIRFLDQKLAVKAENKIPAHFSTLSFQAMGDKCYAVNTNSLYEVSVDGEARLIDMYSTAAISVFNEVYLEPTSVVVDGQKYTKTTNSKGIVSLPINLDIGQYTIKYSHSATSKLNAKSGSTPISVVERAVTSVSWKSETTFYQGTQNCKILVLDSNNKPVSY